MISIKPFSLALLISIAFLGTTSGADAFSQKLQPFFALYCNDCHSDGTDEGGLDLSVLGEDLSDPATLASWIRISDRVHLGEMPPEDDDQPSKAHRNAFSKILNQALTRAHAKQKGTVMRRLNRREYQNTINDLFGVHLDLENRLPEDGRAREFDNIGEALAISLVHLQQYLEAIDWVLNTAIAQTDTQPESITLRTNYAETREGKTHIGSKWKQLKDDAVVQFVSSSYPTGMMRTAIAKKSGRYKIRVTGYAYQSETPITVAVGSTTFQRGTEKPTYGYFTFPPNEPKTIEVEGYMEATHMVDVSPWGLWNREYWIGNKDIDSYPGPGLAIQEVELIGPLVDEFPSRGHQMVFDGLIRREVEPKNPAVKTKSWYVPKFELVSKNPQRDARKVITRVANAAFRRPASRDAIDRHVELFQSEMDHGATMEEALLTAVAAIFCSPDFLYFREPEGWLDDEAIASRLSYFLTRTMPDAELLAAAQQKRLSKDPDQLLHHARRLMNSPHHERFIVDFTDAWLNLRDINFTSPDKKLFPEYDAFLQYSMLEETRQFFATLIKENVSARNLVRSDFAMLNNRLALHYGIDNVNGPEIRRVSLPKSSVRGGLLSQASVLKVSANGTNTSPVVRGIWVMERIVGNKPPPPPPGIPGVEPDVRGASTLRELLEKHRSSDTCRSCHAMIDPPGFALESFNPIGGWRDRFRSLGTGEKSDQIVNGLKVHYKIGPPVDASGQLSDGEEFKNFVEFRDRLAASEERLARALLTKFLTFATGREMGFSDRRSIEKLLQQSKEKGHGIRDLIELTVTSTMFRRK